jgi:hypothetical protein
MSQIHDHTRLLAVMDSLCNSLDSLSCTQLWLLSFWILGMALQRVVNLAIGFCYNKLIGSLERNELIDGGSRQHEDGRNYTRV